MKKSDDPIIVEATFDQNVENVWRAITDVVEMKKWFFENIPAFEAEVGFKTSFPVQSEDRVFTHLWEVIEVNIPRSISYDWSYREYSGRALVVFDLMIDDDKCKLRLTNTVIEDFPSDIPEFKRASCQGGWNYFIRERLTAYFQNN